MAFVERRLDGHVAVVTLNRPEALNALSGEMAREVAGEVLTAASDPAAWVMVLAAAGEKAFCVGADLKERNGLDDAVFGLPETRVGIVPGGAGTQLLPRKIGLPRAKEIVLAGRRISAAEALAWGLVSKVVPRDGLGAASMQLAAEICRNSPVGVQAAKLAMDRGVDVPVEHGIEIEETAWRRAVASEDRREGIAAFNEKRDARWKGR